LIDKQRYERRHTHIVALLMVVASWRTQISTTTTT